MSEFNIKLLLPPPSIIADLWRMVESGQITRTMFRRVLDHHAERRIQTLKAVLNV